MAAISPRGMLFQDYDNLISEFLSQQVSSEVLKNRLITILYENEIALFSLRERLMQIVKTKQFQQNGYALTDEQRCIFDAIVTRCELYYFPTSEKNSFTFV